MWTYADYAANMARNQAISAELSEDILDPKSNIRAGVWYDRFCFERFTDILDARDRLLTAFAAYNCGPSRIRKIIDESDATTFDEIQPHIPFEETRDYVDRIVRFRRELITGSGFYPDK